MHTAHKSSLVTYLAVFVGLAVLTGIEIWLASSGQFDPNTLVLILLGLAAVKAVLVALFFMHLKSDTKWLSLIFIYPLLLASLLIFWVVFPSPR